MSKMKDMSIAIDNREEELRGEIYDSADSLRSFDVNHHVLENCWYEVFSMVKHIEKAVEGRPIEMAAVLAAAVVITDKFDNAIRQQAADDVLPPF